MFYLLRIAMDLLYLLSIVIGFKIGYSLEYPFELMNHPMAKMYFGILGATLVSAAFSVVKATVIFFVKAVGLYSIATKTKLSQAFKETFSRFGSIVQVAVITKLLTEAVEEIREVLLEDGMKDEILKKFPILTELPFQTPLKLVGKYYIKSFTYLDECILAYAFAMNKSIVASIKDSLTQFIKRSIHIVMELVKAQIVTSVANIAVVICLAYLAISRYGFSVPGFLLFFLITKAIIYVLDDALFDPFLLQRVVEDFISEIPSATEQLEQEMNNLTGTTNTPDNEMTTDDQQPLEQTANDEIDNQQSAVDEAVALINKMFDLPAVKKLMSMKDKEADDGLLDD